MVQRSDSTSICDNLTTIYSVTCGNKSGALHSDRLGSGSKGKCIFCENSENKWFTPKEFEKFGGRETSKDWKRSVKLDGKPFYFFLNSGELKIHAFNCYCQICIGSDGGENSEGTPGPIKFFSPPNRKRRAEDELAMPSMISRSQSSNHPTSGFDSDPNDMSQLLSLISQSIDNANKSEENKNSEEDDESQECSVTVSSQANASPGRGTSGLVSANSASCSPPHFQRSIKSAVEKISRKTRLIEEGISSLGGLLTSIKSEISSLKHLVNQYDQNCAAVPNHTLSNDFKSAITDTLAQVLSQSELNKSRKREDTGHCANCNRPAPFKCGRCNLARYCSEFCQQRDWPIHNKICGAKILATCEKVADKSLNLNEVKDKCSKQAIYILEEDCLEESQENPEVHMTEIQVSSDESSNSNGMIPNGLIECHPDSDSKDIKEEIVDIKDEPCDDTVDNG